MGTNKSKYRSPSPLPSSVYFFVFFLWYALTTCRWFWILLFSGPLVDIMGGTVFMTARSIMAKIVRRIVLELNNISFRFARYLRVNVYLFRITTGQVTAVYGIVESPVPIVFGPLYTIIFKNTVTTLPGLYSLIGSTLAVPAIGIYL